MAGIGSGLEALLLMSVAASGLLIGGVYSVGFAALCSLAFLGDVVYSDVYEVFENTRYTEASVLGICCFRQCRYLRILWGVELNTVSVWQNSVVKILSDWKNSIHILYRICNPGLLFFDPVTGIQHRSAQSALQFFSLETMPSMLVEASAELSQRYIDWLADPRQDSFALEGQHGTQILVCIMALQTAGKPYHMIMV